MTRSQEVVRINLRTAHPGRNSGPILGAIWVKFRRGVRVDKEAGTGQEKTKESREFRFFLFLLVKEKEKPRIFLEVGTVEYDELEWTDTRIQILFLHLELTRASFLSPLSKSCHLQDGIRNCEFGFKYTDLKPLSKMSITG